MRRLFVTLSLMFSISVAAAASPTREGRVLVVGDVGPTVSAVNYYSVLKSNKSSRARRAKPVFGGPLRMFPIATPAMSVGPLDHTEREVRLPGPMVTRPIFVIGSDSQSLSWLRQHQSDLRAANSVGFAVSVPDGKAWKLVRETGETMGLSILPLQGDVLVRYGIKHYPVVLTNQGLIQ